MSQSKSLQRSKAISQGLAGKDSSQLIWVSDFLSEFALFLAFFSLFYLLESD